MLIYIALAECTRRSPSFVESDDTPQATMYSNKYDVHDTRR